MTGRRGSRGRGLLRRSVPVLVAVAISAVLAGCSGVPGVYTVERAGSGASPSAGGSGAAFDATAYVAGIWDAKVLPTLSDSAVSASEVLAAIAADPAAAGKKYARQTGSGSPFTYTVKGSGKVLSVDTSGPQGLLAVDLAPGDGKADLSITVGPAVLGTAIRDALPFIDFSQFTNQIDYADVGTALNAEVRQKVLADIRPADIKGKKVDFVGAFALLDPASVVVVPVSLKEPS